MIRLQLAILLVLTPVLANATRGPHCSEYGGCSGGFPTWLNWLLGIGFFALVIRGAYKSNGLTGVVPIALWLLGMPLSVYLAKLGYVPLWTFLVVFTGVWWYDPVMKKIGLRDKDYEP